MPRYLRSPQALPLIVLAAACSSPGQDSVPAPDGPCAAWMDTGMDPDARARTLVAAMTLEQKIDQTHGDAPPDDFRVVLGIEALCIPDLTVTNGPAGVGPGPELLNNVPATALPSPLLLASTWDPGMAEKFGNVQGAEMRAIGRNLLEAPDVDLARVPINGRTFEAAVREAEVGSVMCSYNSINGAFGCESEETLTNILKGDWEFEGFVQSDFSTSPR